MNRLGGEVRYVAFLVFLSVVTMGCMIPAWDVLAEGSFDRTLNVTGPADLEVSTGSGSITVRAGTANLIQIHGTIRVQNHRNTREGAEAKVRALASNPPIEQSGSVIRIGRIEDRELRENVSISYEIVAPEETRLRARTGSGSQTVEGIRGPAEIDHELAFGQRRGLQRIELSQLLLKLLVALADRPQVAEIYRLLAARAAVPFARRTSSAASMPGRAAEASMWSRRPVMWTWARGREAYTSRDCEAL